MEGKNAKIGFFNHQPSGCFWYRIKTPMDALNSNGVPTQLINLNVDVNTDTLKAFQVYGLYPFSFDKVLKTVKEDNKRIIYDLDDAVGYIEKTNPFYYQVMKDASSEREILKYADHITVGTQGIYDYIKTKTNAPITIIPNCFNPKEWTFPRPKRDGIRIGFAGSSTHVDDLIMILPSIIALQSKYDIRFLIMGFGKDSYPEWLRSFRFISTDEGNKALDTLEQLMSQIKFEWIPYVDYEKYPSTLINMSLDIGICPLKDNLFNNCRSASKAMEYTLSGALALASDVQAYRQDPTSILVKDNEWLEQLEFYINNPIIREKVRSEHLSWIRKNRDINTKIDLLKSVYLI